MARRGTSQLSIWEQIRWRERNWREKEREKKEREEEGGERSSTLSLEFPVIGPSVSIRARRKVLLLDESFAWVRESWVFAKLREVGVFLLLGLILSKSQMVEVFGAKTAVHFSPKKLGLNAGFLGLFSDSPGLFLGCPKLKFQDCFHTVRS